MPLSYGGVNLGLISCFVGPTHRKFILIERWIVEKSLIEILSKQLNLTIVVGLPIGP